MAWSKDTKATVYEGKDETDIKSTPRDGKEPEVVWFPEIQGLAIQPHPEWMVSNSKFVDWVLDTVRERIIGETVNV